MTVAEGIDLKLITFNIKNSGKLYNILRNYFLLEITVNIFLHLHASTICSVCMEHNLLIQYLIVFVS